MNRKQAKRLFAELSGDLERFHAGEAGSVRCPLCLKLFGFSDLESKELTVEHIIPNSIGGRAVTLSCRRCNNTDGTKVDSHLVQGLKALDAFEGIGAVSSSIEIAGHMVRADTAFRSGKKGDPITIRLRRANPQAVEQIKAALGSNAVKAIKAHFDFGYRDDRFRLALVRAAYLTLFAEFGYRYILSAGVRHFWSQITAPDADLPQLIKQLTASLGPVVPDSAGPALFIPLDVSFGGAPAYLVILKLTKKARCFAVILPTEHTDPQDIFQKLNAVSSKLSEHPFPVLVRVPAASS